MLTGIAHAALCVPNVDAAARWYEEVLGLKVLSPPYLMQGEDIERDMRELVPSPVALKAAIVGLGDDDHVLELIEYPAVVADGSGGVGGSGGTGGALGPVEITTPGFTHVGIVCDDIAATRAELEAKGVEFVVSGAADVAGLRTTWFRDPWGNVFILLEKRHTSLPYWGQWRG